LTDHTQVKPVKREAKTLKFSQTEWRRKGARRGKKKKKSTATIFCADQDQKKRRSKGRTWTLY